MRINTDNLVPMTEANQNFSKVSPSRPKRIRHYPEKQRTSLSGSGFSEDASGTDYAG